MARRNEVRLKAPNKHVNSVSIEGVEYEVTKGFVTVAAPHADRLLGNPHNFTRVGDEDAAEDDAAEDGALEFKGMSKAELIDFITDRGEKADRKMSKEQLVDLADSVKNKPVEE